MVLYGRSLRTGSVSWIQRQVSEALGGPVEEACHFVRQQKAQHVDETGWRERGERKWLWVPPTRDVTAFEVLDGRGADRARQLINSQAKGAVVTARDWSYNWLAGRRRQQGRDVLEYLARVCASGVRSSGSGSVHLLPQPPQAGGRARAAVTETLEEEVWRRRRQPENDGPWREWRRVKSAGP
jgi:hypothetical protein